MSLKPEEQVRLEMLADRKRRETLARVSSGKSAFYDHATQALPSYPRANAGDAYEKLRNQYTAGLGMGAGRKPLPDLANVLGQTNSYKPNAR